VCREGDTNKNMSIRRSSDPAKPPASANNRGFGVTHTGAIGFSEDVDTEAFSNVLKTNQAMQTQQQVIADLQQKLEKLSTNTEASSSATEGGLCQNNRDAYAKMSHTSWPYSTSMATGEAIDIQKIKHYPQKIVKGAIGKMLGSQPVIKNQINRIMCIYKFLQQRFDVPNNKWQPGCEDAVFETVKKNTKHKEVPDDPSHRGKTLLVMEDIFLTCSTQTSAYNNWRNTLSHDESSKEYVSNFDEYYDTLGQSVQDLINVWIKYKLVSLNDADVRDITKYIQILKASKQIKPHKTAEQWLKEMEKEYENVNGQWRHPAWSTTVKIDALYTEPQTVGDDKVAKSGTMKTRSYTLTIRNIMSSLKFWIASDKFMEIEKTVKTNETAILVMVNHANAKKPVKSFGRIPPVSHSDEEADNMDTDGDATPPPEGKKSTKSQFFTGSHYDDDRHSAHHARRHSSHPDGGRDYVGDDHEHHHHKKHEKQHKDYGTRSAAFDYGKGEFCQCASPIPVSVSRSDFCQCANPIPVRTAGSGRYNQRDYDVVYGPGYKENGSGQRGRGGGPHTHNYNTKSQKRQHHNNNHSTRNHERNFKQTYERHYHGRGGGRNRIRSRAPFGQGGNYLFQGDEFDDYM
jgi:hypothetical protein